MAPFQNFLLTKQVKSVGFARSIIHLNNFQLVDIKLRPLFYHFKTYDFLKRLQLRFALFFFKKFIPHLILFEEIDVRLLMVPYIILKEISLGTGR